MMTKDVTNVFFTTYQEALFPFSLLFVFLVKGVKDELCVAGTHT